MLVPWLVGCTVLATLMLFGCSAGGPVPSAAPPPPAPTTASGPLPLALVDPSFDQGLAAWTVHGVPPGTARVIGEPTLVRTGARAIELRAADADVYVAQALAGATDPGRKLAVEVWARPLTPGARLWLEVHPRGSSLRRVARHTCELAPAGWTRCTAELTAHAQFARGLAEVRIGVRGSDGAIIDDVRLSDALR